MVLIKKEYTQMFRDYKVFWLPIIFILLGATQPLVTYYLPSILEALGGSQGITIDSSLTAQSGGEVLATTLGSQFDQLGLMILSISLMGIIQADKANGMLSFILTRPVTVPSYVVGKLVSNYFLSALSVTIGYFVSYLYVNVLFTPIPFSYMFTGLLFYLLWVLFIVSFTTMISTLFHSQGIIAMISIVVLLGCRIIVGLSPIIDRVNPASMSKLAMETLATGLVNTNAIINILLTLVLVLFTFFITNYWITKKKFHHG